MDYFTKNPNLEYSNSFLKQIRDSRNPDKKFLDSISEISKNSGVTLLALNASKEYLQLSHHPTVIGGNWSATSQKAVSILGFNNDATPIQIIEKSIKEVKEKSPLLDQFAAAINNESMLKAIKNQRTEFHYMNIVPLPHLLTTTFLNLESTDPLQVAIAFFQIMYDFDNQLDSEVVQDSQQKTPMDDDSSTQASVLDDDQTETDLPSPEKAPTKNNTSDLVDQPSFYKNFITLFNFASYVPKAKFHPSTPSISHRIY